MRVIAGVFEYWIRNRITTVLLGAKMAGRVYGELVAQRLPVSHASFELDSGQVEVSLREKEKKDGCCEV